MKYVGFDGTPCERQSRVVLTKIIEQDDGSLTQQDFTIPLVDEGIRTYVEKGNDGDVVRETEVYFPHVWNDTNIASFLSPQYNDIDGFMPAKVQVRLPPDHPTGRTWETIHYGFVRRVGQSGQEGKLRLWIDDISKLFEKVRVPKSGWEFDNGDDVKSVIEKVRKRFNSEYAAEKGAYTLGTSAKADYKKLEKYKDGKSLHEWIEWATNNVEFGAYAVVQDDKHIKKFHYGNASLKTVMDWVCDRTNSYWYIEYDDADDTLKLVYDDIDEREKFVSDQLESYSEERNVNIHKNDALNDLSTVNTVEALGYAGDNQEEWEAAPYAKVTHKELRELMGGEFTVMDDTFDQRTVTEVERAARKSLKERISDSTGGELFIDGAPDMRPYSQIRIPPACEDIVFQEKSSEDEDAENAVAEVSLNHMGTKQMQAIETAEAHIDFY